MRNVFHNKLLVCDLLLKPPFYPKRLSPNLRTWKLRQPNEKTKFKQAFIDKLSDNHPEEGETSTEEIWNRLKSALFDAADNVCSKTKKHHKRETWWWNKKVNSAVAEKRRCWKAWKQGENKELYLQAERAAKHVVYTARKTAEEERFADLRAGKTDVFKIAKQMRKENQDVIGDKCVMNDAGNLSIDKESKRTDWKQH